MAVLVGHSSMWYETGTRHEVTKCDIAPVSLNPWSALLDHLLTFGLLWRPETLTAWIPGKK
jgi:hypothetical protein